MRQLEVFFDYACPYCLKGHNYLTAIKAEMNDLDILWCPCEAHPRPERYGMHSDLTIRAFFYGTELGIDQWQYHHHVYKMIHEEHLDIENVDLLCQSLQNFFDPDALKKVLTSEQYVQQLAQANHYAYEKSGVWAVPAFRMNGMKLDSVENVGVTKEQLRSFIQKGSA
jgi:predicted DsbA family dithiol-disulfide isomerase